MKWGRADLDQLIRQCGAGYSLRVMAQCQGEPGLTTQECDLALWAKFGRTVDQALDVLNARAGVRV